MSVDRSPSCSLHDSSSSTTLNCPSLDLHFDTIVRVGKRGARKTVDAKAGSKCRELTSSPRRRAVDPRSRSQNVGDARTLVLVDFGVVGFVVLCRDRGHWGDSTMRATSRSWLRDDDESRATSGSSRRRRTPPPRLVVAARSTSLAAAATSGGVDERRRRAMIVERR